MSDPSSGDIVMRHPPIRFVPQLMQSALVIAALLPAQGALAQPSLDRNEPARPDSAAGTRLGPSAPRPWLNLRGERTAASLTAQTTDSAVATPGAAPPVCARSKSPQTTTVAPENAACEWDYWIASSRGCSSHAAPCDPACCLSFFHRMSERSLIPERRETFLASVRSDRPVCFVVHGSYNWWGDVKTESRKIHRWIRSATPGTPLQVVFFTWPSDGNMPFIFPVDIAVLGRRSAAHSLYLASLITQLPAEQQVCILGHSHGARTTVAALHLLGGGALEGGQTLRPGFAVSQHLRAVLLAAAIDHDWLNPGQRYSQALAVPERVLLTRNPRDATLAIYPLRKGIGERALGRYGLGRDDRFWLDSMGSKVDELDASSFARWHHAFADYHEWPELAAAIVPYVYFQDDAAVTTGPAINAPTISPPATTPPAQPARAAPAGRQAGFGKSKATDARSKERTNVSQPRNAVELEFEP
jgi:hypothetical protein